MAGSLKHVRAHIHIQLEAPTHPQLSRLPSRAGAPRYVNVEFQWRLRNSDRKVAQHPIYTDSTPKKKKRKKLTGYRRGATTHHSIYYKISTRKKRRDIELFFFFISISDSPVIFRERLSGAELVENFTTTG